jgi:two-component system, LytTR family, response regulator
MKIRAIIVEDEALSRATLEKILERYCSNNVEIVGFSDNVQDSVRLITQVQPDLLFLDIKLGAADNGAFEILQSLKRNDFHVIFTTGEKKVEKILAAHKLQNTISYLLKPLSIDEVIESVDRVRFKMEQNDVQSMQLQIDQMMKFVSTLYQANIDPRVEVPVKSGIEFIPLGEIIMLRASRNNCLIYCKKGECKESTRNLNYFLSVLPQTEFFLTSRSHIINLHYVEKYTGNDGPTVYLANKCQASLSRSRKDEFFKALRAIQKR